MTIQPQDSTTTMRTDITLDEAMDGYNAPDPIVGMIHAARIDRLGAANAPALRRVAQQLAAAMRHMPAKRVFNVYFSRMQDTRDFLLEEAAPGDSMLQFFFGEYALIARHVRAVIERFEGPEDVRRKADWVLERLQDQLVHATPFNMPRQATGQRPTRVLRTQIEALRFLAALRSMHFGNIDPYALMLRAW
jgi:hypothetical protein